MPSVPTQTLSVILVCKNPGEALYPTFSSLLDQRWIELELIVVDGASTDGTREWLEPRRHQIKTLISAPDTNLFDAMNKGLEAAHGEWVLFLGAGDRLVGEMVLSEALNWMKKTEAGVAAGEVAYDDGRIFRLRSSVNPLAHNFVRRQATFYRRELFLENGPFDTALPLMADYEFNLRLWKNRVRFKPLPLRIVASTGSGRTDRGQWQVHREETIARHRYFAANRALLWDVLSVFRCLRQKFTGIFRRR